MKRNTFITSSLLGVTGLASVSAFGRSLQEVTNKISIERIKEFVIAGHKDLDTVKAMLKEEPNLVYARYDWGNGDFEEAIEGAGHVGQKEIAEYLIAQGARVNLFVLTLLGKKQIVIPTLEEFPNLLYAKGPHGFSLLHHAKMGGTDAQEIFDYLTEKGLTETKFKIN